MTVSPSPTPVSLITHVDALPAGTRLAEFELLGLLGVGGFGMVYQAFDHSLQRPVAIKEFMPSALACRGADGVVTVRDPADQAAFHAGLQSFVAEARLLAQFDHPSLVKVFRYWEEHQTAYMVMPFYRGITLQAARMQMRSPPTEAWLRKVLWGVLGALKTLHQGRAVHRDVSPDNIFLQDFGPPVLLDLGAARHVMGGKTQDLTDAFKLSYAPLEQHAGAPDMRQGPWTDLYALAAVVHGLLCNKPPLPATFRAVRDRLPSFSRVARTVQEQFGLGYSPAFVQAMGQALAIDARDRPQTVAAMVQAMALETPNGMSRFDWRAELGPIWAPPGVSVSGPLPMDPSVPGQQHMVPARNDDPTQPLTTPRRKVATVHRQPPPPVPVAEVAAEVAAPSPTPPAPVVTRSGRSWRLGAGVLAVAAVALALGLMLGRGSRSPDSRLAAQVVPSAAEGQPASQAVPADPPPPVLAVASVAAPAVAVPEVPAASVVQPLPSSSPNPVTPARRVTTKKNAPAEVVNPPPAMPVATTAMPERVKAPQRAAAGDPVALCADSNFVTRPMCVFRQCQKPEMAGLAVCVENNARLQNSRRPEGL